MVGLVYNGEVNYINRIEDFEPFMDASVYDALCSWDKITLHKKRDKALEEIENIINNHSKSETKFDKIREIICNVQC